MKEERGKLKEKERDIFALIKSTLTTKEEKAKLIKLLLKEEV